MRTEAAALEVLESPSPLFLESTHDVAMSSRTPLRVVVIGNLRVGDTLWAWKLFQEQDAFNVALCIPYNLDAVQFLKDHVIGANIDAIWCLRDPAANWPLSDIPGYRRWCRDFVPYDRGITYVPWEWDTDCRPWPAGIVPVNEDGVDVAGRVALQLRSNSTWKRWDALDTVPLLPPHFTLGDAGTFYRGTMLRGTIAQSARWLQQSRGLLCIPSAMGVLSTLLGVPTVCCSPWEEQWPNEPPTLRHLFQPTEEAILAAAQDLGIVPYAH